MCELKLFTSKTYKNFVKIGRLLFDFQPKQIFRQTDRQTLNCLPEKNVEIRALIQK